MAGIYSKYSGDGFPSRYIGLKFYPSEAMGRDDWCELMGETTLAESLIRSAAAKLQPLADNAELKKTVLALGKADLLYLDYQTLSYRPPADKQLAVATFNNKRVYAEAVDTLMSTPDPTGASSQYWNFYRARFSMTKVVQANIIQQGKITFKHGLKNSDLCSFDLTKLP